MRCLIVNCMLPAIIASVASGLMADEIVLENGRVLSGRLLEKGETLRLKMIDGIEVLIPTSRTKEIVEKQCLFDEFDSKRQRIGDTDAAALVELATWCKANGLHSSKLELLQQVLKVSPDHEEARNGLGYYRFGGKWHEENALLELVRQPLSDATRSAGDSRLPVWAGTLSSTKSGLHISSVPAGICAYVGRKEEVGDDNFDVANVRFLKGRTPLSLDVDPGSYVVALEQVTDDKQEFQRESGGTYYGKVNDRFLAGIVYTVEVLSEKPSHVVGLFYPADASQVPKFMGLLPKIAPFTVDRATFDTLAERINLPSEKRDEYFKVLSHAGKCIHPKGRESVIVCLVGQNQFEVFTFRPH